MMPLRLKENKKMMKETTEINTLKMPHVIIDKRLNYLSEKVLFSKKVQEATELIARVGVPDLEKILKEDEAKKAKQKAEQNPIASLIQQTRLQRNLSQEALAALVGVDETMIFRLENNDYSVSFETILQVFHVLEAELSFVVKLKQ
jgi:DNA-binding XRE family transcriptional regulator